MNLTFFSVDRGIKLKRTENCVKARSTVATHFEKKIQSALNFGPNQRTLKKISKCVIFQNALQHSNCCKSFPFFSRLTPRLTEKNIRFISYHLIFNPHQHKCKSFNIYQSDGVTLVLIVLKIKVIFASTEKLYCDDIHVCNIFELVFTLCHKCNKYNCLP